MMKAKATVFFCCFMLWPVISLAEEKTAEQESAVTVKHAPMLGEPLRLQVTQAPLRKVLDELSRITEVGIHHSVLAGELVTATCVGDSLKTILDCLLGGSQNIVFQYSQGTEKLGKPIDVWILGSSLAKQGVTGNSESCKGVKSNSVTITKVQQADEKAIAQLMLRLASKDPKQRAEAVADLATKTVIDNADVDKALLNAMDDKATAVREQALFGWVYRKGNEASFELRQALQDSEMSVRMTVVDLTQDSDILALAISDSSELIRKVAQMKLDELESQANEN